MSESERLGLSVRWLRIRAKLDDGTIGGTLLAIPFPWLHRHRWVRYTPGHRDTPILMCPRCNATQEIDDA